MTKQDKAEAIKWLKNHVVKDQKYELAAWLRDKEKELLKELSLPLTGALSDIQYPLRYPQYHYICELLDGFNLGRSYEDIEQMKKKFKDECIDIICEQKINDLLGGLLD